MLTGPVLVRKRKSAPVHPTPYCKPLMFPPTPAEHNSFLRFPPRVPLFGRCPVFVRLVQSSLPPHLAFGRESWLPMDVFCRCVKLPLSLFMFFRFFLRGRSPRLPFCSRGMTKRPLHSVHSALSVPDERGSSLVFVSLYVFPPPRQGHRFFFFSPCKAAPPPAFFLNPPLSNAPTL